MQEGAQGGDVFLRQRGEVLIDDLPGAARGHGVSLLVRVFLDSFVALPPVGEDALEGTGIMGRPPQCGDKPRCGGSLLYLRRVGNALMTESPS